MNLNKMNELKYSKPIYAHCPICFKKYDMVEWGVECPSCKNKKSKEKKTKH